MYKAYYKSLPANIQKLFILQKDQSLRSSKFSNNFVVKRANSTTESNSVSITGVKFWNSLPTFLKNINSVQAFKFQLKQYLLTGQSLT